MSRRQNYRAGEWTPEKALAEWRTGKYARKAELARVIGIDQGAVTRWLDKAILEEVERAEEERCRREKEEIEDQIIGATTCLMAALVTFSRVVLGKMLGSQGPVPSAGCGPEPTTMPTSTEPTPDTTPPAS